MAEARSGPSCRASHRAVAALRARGVHRCHDERPRDRARAKRPTLYFYLRSRRGVRGRVRGRAAALPRSTGTGGRGSEHRSTRLSAIARTHGGVPAPASASRCRCCSSCGQWAAQRSGALLARGRELFDHAARGAARGSPTGSPRGRGRDACDPRASSTSCSPSSTATMTRRSSGAPRRAVVEELSPASSSPSLSVSRAPRPARRAQLAPEPTIQMRSAVDIARLAGDQETMGRQHGALAATPEIVERLFGLYPRLPRADDGRRRRRGPASEARPRRAHRVQGARDRAPRARASRELRARSRAIPRGPGRSPGESRYLGVSTVERVGLASRYGAGPFRRTPARSQARLRRGAQRRVSGAEEVSLASAVPACRAHGVGRRDRGRRGPPRAHTSTSPESVWTSRAGDLLCAPDRGSATASHHPRRRTSRW